MLEPKYKFSMLLFLACLLSGALTISADDRANGNREFFFGWWDAELVNNGRPFNATNGEASGV